jgi:O-antigen/teichoic acid export membrane protein
VSAERRTSADRSPPAPLVEDPVEVASQDESVTEPTSDAPAPFRLASLGGYTMMFAVVTILTKAVSFVMLPVYTRYLRPSQYGAMEMIELSFDVLTMVAGTRLLGGVFRYYYKAETETERNAVLSTGVLLICGGYAIVGAIAYLAAAPLAKLVLGDPSFSGLVRIGALALGSQSLTSLPPALLRVQSRFRTVVVVQLARLAMQVGLNVLFLVHYLMGPNAIFLSTLLANLCVGGVVLVMVVRPVGLHFSRHAAVALYRFGFPLIVVQAATFILTFGDRPFLLRMQTLTPSSAAANLTSVGIYTTAYQFAFALNSLTQTPFSLVWEPKRFEIATHPDHDAIYARVFVYFNVVLMAGALGFAMFTHDVLHIIATKAFYGASDYVPLLVVSIVLQGWAGMHDLGILVSERTKYLAIANWAAAIVTLIAYATLIPRYHLYGAASATIIGYVVRSALTYFFSQRLWPVRYDWAPVIRLVALTGATYGISAYIPWGPLVYMLPVRISMYIVYLIVVVWFAGVISADDRTAALRIAGQFLTRIADRADSRPLTAVGGGPAGPA